MNKTYGIGIAGLGTVGIGFLKQLKNFKTSSSKAANIKVINIAVKNLRKRRSLAIKSLPLTTDTMSLATNEDIDILIEESYSNNNTLSRIMNDDLALLNENTGYRNLPVNLVQGGITRRFGTNTTTYQSTDYQS